MENQKVTRHPQLYGLLDVIFPFFPKVWIDVLLGANMPVEVCRVEDEDAPKVQKRTKGKTKGKSKGKGKTKARSKSVIVESEDEDDFTLHSSQSDSKQEEAARSPPQTPRANTQKKRLRSASKTGETSSKRVRVKCEEEDDNFLDTMGGSPI